MCGEVFPLWSVPLRSVQWAALVRALRRRGGATAALAQSAERLTRNEKVKGSIPLGGSTKKRPVCARQPPAHPVLQAPVETAALCWLAPFTSAATSLQTRA